MSDPQTNPDGVPELEPPSEAKDRIEANIRRAKELNVERDKERKKSAGE